MKYDPDCSCPSRAGIPVWAIVVPILVVLLVAVAIFVIYRYFPLTRVLKYFFNLLAQEKDFPLTGVLKYFSKPSFPGERGPITKLYPPTTEHETKRVHPAI